MVSSYEPFYFSIVKCTFDTTTIIPAVPVSLLLLFSHSPNDVPPVPQRNVSIAAVRGAVRPSISRLVIFPAVSIVNPLCNDIRYNSKIRYNVNPICTKVSGSYTFSLTVPCYSLGKHTFWIFVKIASPRRF